jgi:hypothetical protein
MSIFTTIKEKIFGVSKANAATTSAQPETSLATSSQPIIEVDVAAILDELKSLLLKLQFKDTRNIIEILVSPGHRSDLERPKLDLQNQADKFFTEFIAND